MDVAMQYVLNNKNPLYVCTPCAKARAVTEEMLVEGAQYGTGKILIGIAAESKVFNF